MKIIFSGGAGSVTGSSHLIEVGGHQVLLDCGLYQGADARERGNEEFPFDPAKVDYLVLSHAHIDHSGRIPMLYKRALKERLFQLHQPTTYARLCCGIQHIFKSRMLNGKIVAVVVVGKS